MLLTQLLCSFLLLANAGAAAETTIVVFPTEQFEKSKLAKPLAAEMVSRLQRPGWKVIDGTADKGHKSFLKPVEELIEGRDAKLAMSLDADIYIVFEGQLIISRGVTSYQIALSAYETVTARKLAAEVAMSNPGPGDNSALEACERTVPKVLKQLKDYQEVDAHNGGRYLMALYNPPKDIDMTLAMALKKTCRHVKPKRRGERQDFYTQCKSPRTEIIGVIKKAIRKKHGGKKYTIYPSPRQLIVINFQ